MHACVVFAAHAEIKSGPPSLKKVAKTLPRPPARNKFRAKKMPSEVLSTNDDEGVIVVHGGQVRVGG